MLRDGDRSIAADEVHPTGAELTATARDLMPLLRERGIHVAIGGVALPNDASIALHEKLGFERVATFRQVGFKHDRWVDVAYWQLVL